MDVTPTDPPPEPAPGSPPAPAHSDWTPASGDVLVRLAARKAARLRFLHALYEATEGLVERSDMAGGIAAPRPRLAALREAAVGIRALIEAITRSGRAVGEGLTLMQRAGQVLARLDR